MLVKDSPFRPTWVGTGLDNVGLSKVRPRIGTYGYYDFAALPPLPFDSGNQFTWLREMPSHDDGNIGDFDSTNLQVALSTLRSNCEKAAVRLPGTFEGFRRTPDLHARIRSNTDAYLDLSPVPVAVPVHGYLIRFLADSQGCCFWYLFVTADSSDPAILVSGRFFGAEDEQGTQSGVQPDADEMLFVAPTFEEFIGRFWLESELWFAGWQKTSLPKYGQEYIDANLKTAPRR
jgi:hypothetical protein